MNEVTLRSVWIAGGDWTPPTVFSTP